MIYPTVKFFFESGTDPVFSWTSGPVPRAGDFLFFNDEHCRIASVCWSTNGSNVSVTFHRISTRISQETPA